MTEQHLLCLRSSSLSAPAHFLSPTVPWQAQQEIRFEESCGAYSFSDDAKFKLSIFLSPVNAAPSNLLLRTRYTYLVQSYSRRCCCSAWPSWTQHPAVYFHKTEDALQFPVPRRFRPNTKREEKKKKKKKNEYTIKMFTIRSVLTLLLNPPPASMEEPAQAPPCGSCRTKCKTV